MIEQAKKLIPSKIIEAVDEFLVSDIKKPARETIHSKFLITFLPILALVLPEFQSDFDKTKISEDRNEITKKIVIEVV